MPVDKQGWYNIVFVSTGYLNAEWNKYFFTNKRYLNKYLKSEALF